MKYEDRYSWIDRILHRLAFASIDAQKAMADMEERIYARRLVGIDIDRPVFVTSLPRAGTTLLLEVIGSLDGFASHTYRDMPFLLIPMLWDAISGRFRGSDASFQRAHGDGMTIGYDSPEAFEEVLWRAYWPEKYTEDRIITWSADDTDANGEFEQFMRTHIQKMIALRSSPGAATSRYVSKNNANVSRIPTITRSFPDSIVLIPFRHPVDQAGSMLRQHLNFQKIHREEDFSRRYMRDIGHFDFGENLRPIDFGGWLDRGELDSTMTADFWLKYWRVAFEYILSNPSDNVVLVSYDNCCADPLPALRRIGEGIGLGETADIVQQTGRLRPPNHYEADALGIDPALCADALAVHAALLEQSIT